MAGWGWVEPTCLQQTPLLRPYRAALPSCWLFREPPLCWLYIRPHIVLFSLVLPVFEILRGPHGKAKVHVCVCACAPCGMCVCVCVCVVVGCHEAAPQDVRWAEAAVPAIAVTTRLGCRVPALPLH
jgi:hypothetical protein